MPSILIVDDEYGLAEMAGELLSALGFNVATAINGKLAIASLAQMRPDVILLDVMMPIMSGPEVLAHLKADPDYKDIPVIMMSAAGRELLTPEHLALVAGFLQKPFSFDEMMTAIKKALPAA